MADLTAMLYSAALGQMAGKQSHLYTAHASFLMKMSTYMKREPVLHEFSTEDCSSNSRMTL